MIKQYLFACIMVLALFGCTRNGAGSKMNVSISAESLMHQRDSAMTSTPPLQSVIVNIRPATGGTPQVIHRDFDSSATTYNLDFDFSNVPTGDIIVQALAVYANSGGGMQIKYGDATINFPTVTTANISPSTTSITKQTYVAGRVQMPDGSYPTGTLVALFTPPGGKPQMVVDSKTIVSGWFNIFAVNGTGAAFDYVVKETGATVFSGLNSDLTTDASGAACVGGSLSGGCPLILTSQNRVKVSKPASYFRNGDFSNPLIQVNPPTDYVLGFFGNLAGAGSKVCYAPDVYEAIPRLFADATLSTPLEVKFASGTAAQVNIAGGGTASFTSSSLYTNGATSVCDNTQISNGNALILNHTLLGDNDENFGGFNSPWMMVQPFNQNGNQYVSVVTNPAYNTTATYSSGNSTVSLNSSFQPAVGSHLAGTGLSGNITTVTGGSGGVWSVIIDTAPSSGGTAAAVTLSQPYAQLQWSLLPGIAFTYSSIALSSGSSSLSIPTISEPIVQGLYVRDIDHPSSIANGTTVSTVAGTSPYVVTLNGSPSASGTDTLSFSYISGVEVWGRPIYSGQATTNGSTDVVISPAMANSIFVGQPISGTNIPSGATVVSIVDSSHITISAAATGSSTTGYVMMGNSNYGGGNNDCAKLPANGFTLLTPNGGADPSIGKFSYSGLSGLPVGSNVTYQFALCAVVGTGTTKSYLGSYVTGQPAWSGDDDRWPFGWANSTKVNATAVDPINDLGITSSKLTAISAAAGLTQLTTATSVAMSANDEVMISIVAHGAGATDCGPGNNGAGAHTFARALSASSTTIVIPSGTWVDQLALANLSGTVAAGGNYCYVEVTHVAQYRNLTFASGMTNSSNAGVANLLGSEAILPIRVNGTLSLNGPALLSGTGYMGGVYSSGVNGAGDGGPYSASSGNGKGGMSAASGGGGAGYGAGGTGASSGSGGLATSNYGGDGLFFSVGGGGAAAGTANGGNGGGALMLAAFNLSVGSSVTIAEDGLPGSSFSGGGGGGSINLIANSVTGSSALILSAQGGAGGTSGGGPGGGGFVSAMACSSSIALNPVINAGTPGSGASAGGFGLSEINYATALSSKRWCY
jgi:hypothetical protein